LFEPLRASSVALPPKAEHIFFRFDPTGVLLGTQRISENLRVAPDGDSYTAVAISNLFDTNGNQVAGPLRATITATRIQVVRIPDQPKAPRGEGPSGGPSPAMLAARSRHPPVRVSSLP
jgi:hypothetical protein